MKIPSFKLWCIEQLDTRGSVRGSELKAACPWCDHADKFSVNVDKGVFQCFRGRCGATGSSIKLVSKVLGVGFSQAAKALSVEPRAFSRAQKTSSVKRFAHALPTEFIPCHDANREKVWRVIKYLAEREISRETLKAFGVGFALTGDHAGRVLIPVNCPNGSAWQARLATGEEPKPWNPKYKNPSGTWAVRAIGGFDEYKRDSWGADVIICEGPFDALKLASLGAPSLWLLGKKLTAEKRALLFQLPAKTAVTIMIDGDERRVVSDGIASALMSKFSSLYVANLRAGLDPGQITSDELRVALDNAQRFA